MSRDILVVDLEATCWDDRDTSVSDMDVIEFGCAIVSSDGTVLDDYSTFVRPTLNPVLSEFCTKLTSISQADVDQAPEYPDACLKLDQWLGERRRGLIWGSWGNYDKNQLLAEYQRHQVFPAFLALPHVNLKKIWAKSVGTPPKGMMRALSYSGFEAEGTHHRGIDDARNIAKLVPELDRNLINLAVLGWQPIIK